MYVVIFIQYTYRGVLYGIPQGLLSRLHILCLSIINADVRKI